MTQQIILLGNRFRQFCVSAFLRPAIWSQHVFEIAIRVLPTHRALVIDHFTRKPLRAIFRTVDA